MQLGRALGLHHLQEWKHLLAWFPKGYSVACSIELQLARGAGTQCSHLSSPLVFALIIVQCSCSSPACFSLRLSLAVPCA
jgi:hypothetical protein